MNDNEIKELLDNLEVQPSARCWEAIDSALGAAGSSSAVAAQATRHLSSTAVKGIIAGSIAAVVTAGALVTALLLSHPDESATAPTTSPAETSTATPQHDATALLPDTSTNTHAPDLSPLSHTVSNESTIENTPTEIPTASVTNEIPTLTETSTAPAVITTQPTATISTSPQQSHTQPTPKANVSTTQSPSTPQPVDQTEDPVLEGRTDIETTPPIAIEIPNVITPNGDGYNDQFIIKGIENCEKSKLIIQSRSGATVLRVNNYQNNWDAQNAPDGTYYYQLYYTIHGIEQYRSGTLVIIR